MGPQIDPQLQQDDELNFLLSPAQSYPPDSIDNFFICKVCLQVIQDPKECSKCQTAFCGKCIDDWVKSLQRQRNKGINCPIRCEDVEFKEIHRFANERLKQTQFKCSYIGCQQVNTYELAIKHSEICDYRVIKCACEQTYQLGQINLHAQQCDKVRIKCQKCNIFYLSSQKDQHDCISTYKQIVNKYRNQQDKLIKMINVFCPNGHCLFPQVGPAEFHIKQYGFHGGNTQCDYCRRSMLQKDKLYWRCQELCDYDICHKCIYTIKK
ncbi:traf-type zinc finger family protein [Stylonychia lemnae]|uniref:Traf-type zinc finger family protein n=1 Tax=Stylonychia lemnae TaxID=5949 RepID=A0A078AY33_STYLE|nr:traf-type zinc finger family protein [Stylonychia lemnae]|eukprot:CDW87335.1 traf-type zinc finger family protein [Stylonychia lemnae]